MPETYTAAFASTGTGLKQRFVNSPPAGFAHSTTSTIIVQRSTASSPRAAQNDLRIVLTGAGTSAFIGEIIAPGCRAIAEKYQRHPDD